MQNHHAHALAFVLAAVLLVVVAKRSYDSADKPAPLEPIVQGATIS